MTINKIKENNTTVYELEGRLDTLTSPQLQTELIPAFDNTSDIILDFSKLVYVSSAGLRVLLLARKTAGAKKGSFSIRNVSPEIMEVFSMTGFSDILKID